MFSKGNLSEELAKGKKITKKWVFEWHINGKGILGVNLETQKNSHLRGLIKTEKKSKKYETKNMYQGLRIIEK